MMLIHHIAGKGGCNDIITTLIYWGPEGITHFIRKSDWTNLTL